jgi:hypothetical protein
MVAMKRGMRRMWPPNAELIEGRHLVACLGEVFDLIESAADLEIRNLLAKVRKKPRII